MRRIGSTSFSANLLALPEPEEGLQRLVYLHRYTPVTATTLLTEYVRPLREKMVAQARLLEVTGSARDASAVAMVRLS